MKPDDRTFCSMPWSGNPVFNPYDDSCSGCAGYLIDKIEREIIRFPEYGDPIPNSRPLTYCESCKKRREIPIESIEEENDSEYDSDKYRHDITYYY